MKQTAKSLTNEQNQYISRIVDVCNRAIPNQIMMFDNFGLNKELILNVQKNSDFVIGTDEYNMVDISVYQKNGIVREGRYKDLLLGDMLGVHITDLQRILTDIMIRKIY